MDVVQIQARSSDLQALQASILYSRQLHPQSSCGAACEKSGIPATVGASDSEELFQPFSCLKRVLTLMQIIDSACCATLGVILETA